MITGVRCVSNCDNGPVDPDNPGPETLWSDSATWANRGGVLPIEGDDVVIDSNMNVVYDLGDSPVFKSIEVNGILKFKYG